MIRNIAAIAALVLEVSAPSIAAAEPLKSTVVGGMPHWHWEAPANTVSVVRLDLIRADVTILASTSDKVTVDFNATGRRDSAERLSIDVTSQGNDVAVSDRFPQRSPWSFGTECLPPSDARGDFWLITNRLTVTIRVPVAVTIIVSVRDGPIDDRRPSKS